MRNLVFSDGASYVFTDNLDTITINIQFTLDTLIDAIIIHHTPSTLHLLLNDTSIIKGRLYSNISSCTWLLEESKDFKLLSIFLTKDSPEMIIWPILIQSGLNSTNASDLDPHSIFILAESVIAFDQLNSLKLLSFAADNKNIPALLKLAAWYEIGKEELDVIPVSKNLNVSLHYHTLAAELGSCEASYILMSAYIHGSDVLEKSYKTAIEWGKVCLSNFYINEFPDIKIMIHWQSGLLWMEGGSGLGDPQPSKAVDEWKISSELGHAQSNWNLGIFLINGFGIDQDVETGISYITKGISIDEKLEMPPQLKGLTKQELEKLVELSKMTPKGSFVDIKSLVTTAKAQILMENNSETTGNESIILQKFTMKTDLESAVDEINIINHQEPQKEAQEKEEKQIETVHHKKRDFKFSNWGRNALIVIPVIAIAIYFIRNKTK